MSSFILVCADESTKNEGVELPAEKNGTLLLSMVQSQFEGASGLKYRNPTTGGWRAVKLVDGVLHPPENGWGASAYIVVIAATKPDSNGDGEEQPQPVVFPPPSSPPAVGYSGDGYKRKLEDGEGQRASKNPRSSSPDYLPFASGSGAGAKPQKGEDLIVLGLEWTIKDAELKEYFEQFGEVILAEVKKDQRTNQSRGFGFVRFADKEVQTKVYDMKHKIKGRRVELKYPRQSPSYLPSKLFVGCLPLKPEVTTDELREHFSQFGQLSDVYIPQPYRGFGFVTFVDPKVIQRVLGMQHTLRKSTLNITFADPKGGTSHHKPQHFPYQSGFPQATFDPFQNYYPQQQYQHSHFAYATPHNTSAYGYGSYAQPQSGGNYSRGPPSTVPPPPPPAAAQTERQGQGFQQQYHNHPPSPGQRAGQYGETSQANVHRFTHPTPSSHQQPSNQPSSYHSHSDGYTISNESVGYQRGSGGQQYHGPPAETHRNQQQQQLYDPKQIWQNY